MAIEEPKYTVVSATGTFEVRKYDPIVVAETEVEGDFSDAGSAGFRVLADYIFGNNESKTKIEMTAPVGQSTSEKIAMTAPVTLSGDKGKFLIQFTLPEIYNLENAPTPNNAKVKLRLIPTRKVAVHSYSGSWSESSYKKELDNFQTELNKSGVKTIGQPVFARFNSPFAIWFLRRNEIWVQIAEY